MNNLCNRTDHLRMFARKIIVLSFPQSTRKIHLLNIYNTWEIKMCHIIMSLWNYRKLTINEIYFLLRSSYIVLFYLCVTNVRKLIRVKLYLISLLFFVEYLFKHCQSLSMILYINQWWMMMMMSIYYNNQNGYNYLFIYDTKFNIEDKY